MAVGQGSRLPDASEQDEIAAGMLGAEKKNDAQRLLLDRRPLNAIEDRLVGEALPFAGDFVRLELSPDEIIRTSLRDGKDQYYVLDPGDARVDWQTTESLGVAIKSLKLLHAHVESRSLLDRH